MTGRADNPNGELKSYITGADISGIMNLISALSWGANWPITLNRKRQVLRKSQLKASQPPKRR